jgi:hypothetical protein
MNTRPIYPLLASRSGPINAFGIAGDHDTLAPEGILGLFLIGSARSTARP